MKSQYQLPKKPCIKCREKKSVKKMFPVFKGEYLCHDCFVKKLNLGEIS